MPNGINARPNRGKRERRLAAIDENSLGSGEKNLYTNIYSKTNTYIIDIFKIDKTQVIFSFIVAISVLNEN